MELVVVLVVISLFLVFALPTVKGFNIFSDNSNPVGKTVQLINFLKKKAVSDNHDQVMHVDITAGIIWISDDSMDEEAMNMARENGVQFSGDTLLVDVEFPQSTTLAQNTIQDSVAIRFHSQGYSDMALIHIQEEEKDMTLRIEPFLSSVEVENRNVSFDQCM